jgi:hypothetical protein
MERKERILAVSCSNGGAFIARRVIFSGWPDNLPARLARRKSNFFGYCGFAGNHLARFIVEIK